MYSHDGTGADNVPESISAHGLSRHTTETTDGGKQMLYDTDSDSVSNRTNWWERLHFRFVCPLTRKPICTFSYAPFKFLVAPPSKKHRYVDGKPLAILWIAYPGFHLYGRPMTITDLAALDQYIIRGNLSKYRPGHVVALAMDSVSAETFELRDEAAREFNVYGSPHASSYNNNKMHILQNPYSIVWDG